MLTVFTRGEGKMDLEGNEMEVAGWYKIGMDVQMQYPLVSTYTSVRLILLSPLPSLVLFLF